MKWKHLKKHVFGAKITQASLQIIKRYVPKTKASMQCLQSYLIFLKGYVERLERNYIDISGSGGDSSQRLATFQNIR